MIADAREKRWAWQKYSVAIDGYWNGDAVIKIHFRVFKCSGISSAREFNGVPFPRFFPSYFEDDAKLERLFLQIQRWLEAMNYRPCFDATPDDMKNSYSFERWDAKKNSKNEKGRKRYEKRYRNHGRK